MPFTHADLATALAHVPDRLERLGANPIRVRACRNATRAVDCPVLDLTDARCRTAKDESAPAAIYTDAHSVHDFDNLVHGIGRARRGWLERADVLNTRPLDSLLRWLKRKEAR